MRIRLALMGVALLLIATQAQAAKWQQIAQGLFLDVSSIRTDHFPDPAGTMTGIPNAGQYKVAWLLSGGVRIEAIFDCKGQHAVMQQSVQNETAKSQYHSFNNTQSFRSFGVQFSSIIPDSIFEIAQPIVCR